MVATITKTSTGGIEGTVVISSLDDLIQFVKDSDNSVIIDFDDDGNLTLEIYDDYRE
jgi:hypothetical protein